jgi:hypothetical protein
MLTQNCSKRRESRVDEAELQIASEEFGGHCHALTLLGGYLTDAFRQEADTVYTILGSSLIIGIFSEDGKTYHGKRKNCNATG